MIKRVLAGAALLLCAHHVMADDLVRLECEATPKSQTSYKSSVAGKTAPVVDVVLNGQAVRRVIVYGENKRLAVVEAVKPLIPFMISKSRRVPPLNVFL